MTHFNVKDKRDKILNIYFYFISIQIYWHIITNIFFSPSPFHNTMYNKKNKSLQNYFFKYFFHHKKKE